MPTLIVTAKKLNKRSRIPANFPDPASIAGVVREGYVFEGREVRSEEIPNHALGAWYVDRDGYFYWGGGVNESAGSSVSPDDFLVPSAAEETIVEGISYQRIVSRLNNSWLKANGKNTTIAIIDTGVSATESQFNTNLISEIDITDGISPDKDHGTFIAGLVCGKGNMINGIASDANILSVRYKDDLTGLDMLLDNMAIALDKVLQVKQNNPALKLSVNISQGLKKHQTELFPGKVLVIAERIKTLVSNNVLIFCAAGENRDLLDGNLLFPSLLPETISVGCITADFLGRPLSNAVDFITALQTYRSYNTAHDIVPDSGSSFSVAVMTSISVLINSSQPVQTKAQLKVRLDPFKKDLSNFRFSDSEYEFFINK